MNPTLTSQTLHEFVNPCLLHTSCMQGLHRNLYTSFRARNTIWADAGSPSQPSLSRASRLRRQGWSLEGLRGLSKPRQSHRKVCLSEAFNKTQNLQSNFCRAPGHGFLGPLLGLSTSNRFCESSKGTACCIQLSQPCSDGTPTTAGIDTYLECHWTSLAV